MTEKEILEDLAVQNYEEIDVDDELIEVRTSEEEAMKSG